MGHKRYSTDEIVARGKNIYETQLKQILEPNYIGKFLVIDIETGEYEIDEDDMSAALKSYNKKPNAVHFEMQIGYAASGTLGNAFTGVKL